MSLKRLVYDFFAKSFGFGLMLALLMLVLILPGKSLTAAEPPAYNPQKDIAELRQDVAELKARMAAVEAVLPNYTGLSKVAASAVLLCKCGCVETGLCQCKNCDEHTADKLSPNHIAAPAPPVQYREVQVCENGVCKIVRVPVTQISEPGIQGVNPAYFGPTTVGSGDCASGNCGTAGSFSSGGGFHPLQNLRARIQQRRGGSRGGCSSCGG